MEDDEIRADFNNTPEEERIEPNNAMLDEVLEKYNCYSLIPLANRIVWLSSFKEALGYIPEHLYDYEELQLLLILQDERNKRIAYENYKLKQESERSKASAENMTIEN